MNQLKNINLYNLIKIITILMMTLLSPIMLLNKGIKKYVKRPISKLIKAFNI